MGKKAQYGWSVTRRGGSNGPWVIYKRDCPEYITNLRHPTQPTKKAAEAYVAEQKAKEAANHE